MTRAGDPVASSDTVMSVRTSTHQLCVFNPSIMLGYCMHGCCCPARSGTYMMYIKRHVNVQHRMRAIADAASADQLWPGWPDECALGAPQNVKRVAQRANARHAPRIPHKLAGRLHLLPAHTML